MPTTDDRTPIGLEAAAPMMASGDREETAPADDASREDLLDAEEDDLFGAPPGSDLDDPADDDW